MPNSPRMNWPYPSENQNLWYEAFKSFIDALDASGFAAREDRSLVLTGGGTVTWTTIGSLLTWTQPIQIVSPLTGFLLSIPAGSVTLEVGQFLYATLVRAPTRNQNINVAVGNQVPSNDQDLLLAVRVGTSLVFGSGMILTDGGSSDGISPGSGGGGGGIGAGTYISFGPYSYTQAPAPVEEVIGQFTFDGSLVGTATVNFAGIMTPVFTSAGWARLRLYDMGPSGGPFGVPRLVSTLQRVAGGLMDVLQALTVVAGAPGADQILDTKRVYEVVVIQSSAPGDTVYVGSVGLEVV